MRSHLPWLHIATFAACISMLLGVFALYLDPHVITDVATRVWSCF